LPLNSDAARRSLTVHSGLDFFDPDHLIQIKGRHHPGHIPHWGLDTDMAAQPTVVIVVDDNAGFLKGVARLLAHNGIESRTFASAEALLESGSAQTATCLLLDIHLGGISGIELQRRLAASGSKCPVIFMTANDDEATRNDAVDAGCIAYLRKPFARDVLMDAIGKAVA
jgi:FixJ family two-component response regulator